MAEPQFFYGGQAVIEGVMIRGRRHFSLSVRRQSGRIQSSAEPLSQVFSGPVRRVPLLRGILVLIETLMLGIKALNRSASIAMADQMGEEHEIPRWMTIMTMALGFSLGIGLFFLMPLFATSPLERVIDSEPLVNLIEGVVRLVVLIAYIAGIGLMKDVRRVFAYHGAEHMAVHTHEADLPLEVENVRRFPTAHPRCGTAFLLTVAVVAVVVFAFIPRDPFWWLVTSRIVFVPVIAAISYEVIRFNGAHLTNPIARAIGYPGILLQSLTTRIPDDEQIEVAIDAMKTALAADRGETPQVADDSDEGSTEATEGETAAPAQADGSQPPGGC
ncbi:MAG: DUF1385 domain-containing protein [Dehalococcoidia bacterium]|nr:DUF1385 domain-containing protein [Dehalococcoidia bacterium]